ncbi:MAG: hypothetical protein U0Q15_10445 [Kineosporiaceae bacterium]
MSNAPETTPAADAYDITIEDLDTVSGGLSVSSLACAACPVSSFSSLSNSTTA